jgi:hypothetical protein
MQMSSMRASQAAAPRWLFLRGIAIIVKVVAILVLLAGLGLGAFGIVGISEHAIGVKPIPGGFEYAPLPFTVVSFAGGIVLFILLYVFAEFINLLIAIERNTRNRYA